MTIERQIRGIKRLTHFQSLVCEAFWSNNKTIKECAVMFKCSETNINRAIYSIKRKLQLEFDPTLRVRMKQQHRKQIKELERIWNEGENQEGTAIQQ